MKLIQILCCLLLILSGCSTREQVVCFEDSLICPEHEFVLQSCDVKEGCYRIENEMEAAALMVNLIHQKQYDAAILVSDELDMNKAYAYALTISPSPFELEYSIRPLIERKKRLNMKMRIPDENRFQENLEQAEEIVDQLSKSGSQDLIRDLHDWIVLNTEYDQEATGLQENDKWDSDSYHARGVFENGKATCLGYTEAYHLLLNAAGIRSMKVFSHRMNHSWNAVIDEGRILYIDTTYDDPVPDVKNAVRYEYYDMKEEQLNKDHYFDESGPDTLDRAETEAFLRFCYGNCKEK